MIWSICSTFLTPIQYVITKPSAPVTGHFGSYEIWMIVLLTVFTFAGQLLQTRAYQLEKAGRVAPITGLQLIFNWLLDYIVLETTLTPNVVIGGALIICTNMAISMLKCFNVIK